MIKSVEGCIKAAIFCPCAAVRFICNNFRGRSVSSRDDYASIISVENFFPDPKPSPSPSPSPNRSPQSSKLSRVVYTNSKLLMVTPEDLPADP